MHSHRALSSRCSLVGFRFSVLYKITSSSRHRRAAPRGADGSAVGDGRRGVVVQSYCSCRVCICVRFRFSVSYKSTSSSRHRSAAPRGADGSALGLDLGLFGLDGLAGLAKCCALQRGLLVRAGLAAAGPTCGRCVRVRVRGRAVHSGRQRKLNLGRRDVPTMHAATALRLPRPGRRCARCAVQPSALL